MRNSLVICVFMLLGFMVNGQVIEGASNKVQFKGTKVLAEEQRVQAEERKRLEQKDLEEAKRREEQRQYAEKWKIEATAVTLSDLGIDTSHLPNYYALIMGVSEYEHSGPELVDLDYPVSDAQRLAGVLGSEYIFDKGHMMVLSNPTRSKIIGALDELADVVNDKDNLLVFFAGHGYWDRTKELGYWLPADADPRNKSQWIANSTLIDYLGAIKAKHTLLIADACFSGSIFKSRSIDLSSMLMKFNELYKYKSRTALTSGNLTAVPDKSVFVEYLIKQLEESPDLLLHSGLLYTRIYEPISNNAKVLPQHGVIQGVGDEGGDFVFIKRR